MGRTGRTTRTRSRRWRLGCAAVVLAVVAAACGGDDGDDAADEQDDRTTTTSTATTSRPDEDDGDDGPTEVEAPPTEDRAFYILPPGNFGGLPTNDDSLDQLPLYDGLTPLRGDVTDADLEEFFLPMDFAPVGATVEEPTGRPGTTIVYDEFGIAHITGETRADVAFGAGWVTARDRGLLLDFVDYLQSCS